MNIHAENLARALLYAIPRLEAEEKEMGYTGPSALLDGWRNVLEAYRRHEPIVVANDYENWVVADNRSVNFSAITRDVYHADGRRTGIAEAAQAIEADSPELAGRIMALIYSPAEPVDSATEPAK